MSSLSPAGAAPPDVIALSPSSLAALRDCVEMLEEHLKCSVCHSTVRDPISMCCGHFYCRPCVDSLLSRNEGKCAVCRKVGQRRNCVKDMLIQNMAKHFQQLHVLTHGALGLEMLSQASLMTQFRTAPRPQPAAVSSRAAKSSHSLAALLPPDTPPESPASSGSPLRRTSSSYLEPSSPLRAKASDGKREPMSAPRAPPQDEAKDLKQQPPAPAQDLAPPPPVPESADGFAIPQAPLRPRRSPAKPKTTTATAAIAGVEEREAAADDVAPVSPRLRTRRRAPGAASSSEGRIPSATETVASETAAQCDSETPSDTDSADPRTPVAMSKRSGRRAAELVSPTVSASGGLRNAQSTPASASGTPLRRRRVGATYGSRQGSAASGFRLAELLEANAPLPSYESSLSQAGDGDRMVDDPELSEATDDDRPVENATKAKATRAGAASARRSAAGDGEQQGSATTPLKRRSSARQTASSTSTSTSTASPALRKRSRRNDSTSGAEASSDSGSADRHAVDGDDDDDDDENDRDYQPKAKKKQATPRGRASSSSSNIGSSSSKSAAVDAAADSSSSQDDDLRVADPSGTPASSGSPSDDSAGDDVCHVCCEDDPQPDNPIVFCDGCDIAVHQACYGILAVPEGDWFCDVCDDVRATKAVAPSAAAASAYRCCLCPNTEDRALKPTTDKRWIHVSCALWITGPQFVDADQRKPVSHTRSVEKARRSLVCRFCRKRGACLQCTFPRCRESYHVPCGHRNGIKFELRDAAEELAGKRAAQDKGDKGSGKKKSARGRRGSRSSDAEDPGVAEDAVFFHNFCFKHQALSHEVESNNATPVDPVELLQRRGAPRSAAAAAVQAKDRPLVVCRNSPLGVATPTGASSKVRVRAPPRTPLGVLDPNAVPAASSAGSRLSGKKRSKAGSDSENPPEAAGRKRGRRGLFSRDASSANEGASEEGAARSGSSAPTSGAPAEPPRDVVIMYTRLSQEEQATLAQMARKCATPAVRISVVTEWSPRVTHLVTGGTTIDDDGVCLCPRTLKYFKAVLAGRWILHFGWVRHCLTVGEPVYEGDFTVSGDLVGFAGADWAKERAQERFLQSFGAADGGALEGEEEQVKPAPLFAGYEVLLYGPWKSVPEDAFRELAELAGAARVRSWSPELVLSRKHNRKTLLVCDDSSLMKQASDAAENASLSAGGSLRRKRSAKGRRSDEAPPDSPEHREPFHRRMSSSSLDMSEDFDQGKKQGCLVVSRTWFFDCISQFRVVPPPRIV